jgi:26S proteasome regulatory subunit N11
MLGQFIDDYTIHVHDVFAMPQSGTAMTVEAVDPVFQTKMLDMLKQVGRPEMVVGWYHSHPGWGCWLSGIDVNTQQSFEQLNNRAVAVVVDPVQSVKGKVVIDAFRCINPLAVLLGQEPRQTTSNVGHLKKPSIQALLHGLNRNYYSMPISYCKHELEQKMLLNLHKSEWAAGLKVTDWDKHEKSLEELLQAFKDLSAGYEKLIRSGKDTDEVANVGKLNSKNHLEMEITNTMNTCVNQMLGTMLAAVVF